ncbi:MAG: chemotaxis protein CheC [Flavonifractor plautii]
MAQNIFSAMELDAIGEMMNISLGSSATAVSNLLDHRVDITTPKVTVVPISEFTLGELEPAIGVEIKYVSGLEGEQYYAAEAERCEGNCRAADGNRDPRGGVRAQ